MPYTKFRIVFFVLFLALISGTVHAQDFTDRDLEKILKVSLKAKSQGVIYLWSPHMPLSIRGVKEVEQLAKSKKWNLTVLRDPYANKVLAQNIAAKEKFPKIYLRRLESLTLLRRELSLHYPSLIVYRSGHLANDIRGGYDDPKRLEKFLALEFDKIRQPAGLFELPWKGIFQTSISMAAPEMPSAKSQAWLNSQAASAPTSGNGKGTGSDTNSVKNSYASQPEICHWAPFGVIKRTAPRRAASYFFRVFPTQNLVSYAGVAEDGNAGGDRNYVLNLEDRKETLVPGIYDPVPICENIMTVPSASQYGMKFYSIPKLMSGGGEATIASIPLMGVYQSVSACPEGGKGEVRLITDDGGATMARLKVDTTVEPAKLEMIGAAQPICTNVNIKFPMLSKDGLEISGRDQNAQTSKIWKINDDGTCQEIFNFGSILSNSPDSKLLVGKADFSFDGRKLAFHVRSDLDDGEHFSRPSRSMAMNIYVYDRVEKTLKKITNNYDRNSYYPVWKKDGTLVYMDMTFQDQMSFIWLDPDKSPAIPVDADYDEQSQAQQYKRYQSLMVLGRTWHQVCSEQGSVLNVDAAVLTALSLDEEDCKQMVSQNWNKMKSAIVTKAASDHSARNQRYNSSSILKNTDEDLKKFCPTDTRILKDIEVVGDLDDTIVQTAQGLIEAKCVGCHQDKGFNNPGDLLQNITLVNEMLSRVRTTDMTKRMPYGSSLSERDLSRLENYLKGIVSGQIRNATASTPEGHRSRVRISRPKSLPALPLTSSQNP